MTRRIEQAAVIGSGVMGGGIAALLASAGIKTMLLDIVPFDLTDKERNDPKIRNKIVKTGFDNIIKARPAAFMHKNDADLVSIGNLEDDFDKLSQCDWIIEVVVENLGVKRELFKRIEGVRKKSAIISTNTSGIPLKDISQDLSQEFCQHFLGTHFFNPVRYMHLLEMIPGDETLPEVLEFMSDFGEQFLGKGIVWAKDTPNFVGNRIGAYSIAHSIHTMMEHGLTIPEADAVMGPVMGRPNTAIFRTCDLVGLDIINHVGQNMYDLVPDDNERDRFIMPTFAGKMLEKNMLGNKTRGGFYKKEKGSDGKTTIKVINPDTFEYETFEKPVFMSLQAAKKENDLSNRMKMVIYGEDKAAIYAWKVLSGYLVYSANRIPEISDTIVEIDNAMKWGYNFSMGPFESWDAIGVARSVEKMESEGIMIPQSIKKMLKAGHKSFYKTQNGKTYYFDFDTETYKEIVTGQRAVVLPALKDLGKVVKTCSSASLIDIGDNVFCCEFHTKMNALNSEMVQFIHESLDYVENNGIGMVFGNQAGGMPGAFCAGADLMELITGVKQGKLKEIELSVQRQQSAMQRARYSAFPVVAAPYGLTLGGGCEIALGSDRMVAHSELYMGLVEVGVGLLPAGGGCLNLWKNFVNSIPEAVTDIDLGKYFVPMFLNVAMAKVSMSAAEARANGFLGSNDRIVFNRDNLIGEAKKEVLKMVSDGYVPPPKRKIQVMGEMAQSLVNVQIADMVRAGYVSEYDAFLSKKIAYVIGGGDVKMGTRIDEEVILKLEIEAFVEFLKQEKTQNRIEHMLKTGKPLRN
ncbi:MAG: 3-hydroxyacyl-CoA dehydrogenase/enoyl-CoA hydratase family protein [Deltaproteobacteria bacterium]|nr:MAG: 3-hydroxyacyl-CoA dehydrogenase/enoyl-CoA hydratase family protein [Deltaproteobacteria bacterium]